MEGVQKSKVATRVLNTLIRGRRRLDLKLGLSGKDIRWGSDEHITVIDWNENELYMCTASRDLGSSGWTLPILYV
jgi:hypothetical protein